jgi:hypothetical protein
VHWDPSTAEPLFATATARGIQHFGSVRLVPAAKWLRSADCAQNSLATFGGTRMHPTKKTETASAPRRALTQITRALRS